MSPSDEIAWRELTTERQAWLVCRPTAEQSSRRWYDQLGRVLGGRRSSYGAGLGRELADYARADRLGAMQFAVSELVSRLTEDEVATLREQRALPPWFLPDMIDRAKVIQRELRDR